MAISVEEALSIVYANTTARSTQILPLESIVSRVLAEDIVATHDLPPYDNSAMDGYAVKVADAGSCVEVTHTILAGDRDESILYDGACAKIMTGARIPAGTESIVPIEDVLTCDEGVKLPDTLRSGQHIRLRGEDIGSDDPLLQKGERLFAHHITLLASQGISHVKVFKRPRVAIFASGSELKMHFERIEGHQLYNTNTPTFAARVQELGCEVDLIGTAIDTLESLQEHIENALDSDLIITSGGVSVGDADYTKQAFGTFDIEVLFDKVDIKPGKPTTFGKIGKTIVLNLPGNPMAAAMNLELFGKSIILALSGADARYLGTIDTVMGAEYRTRPGRRSLIPGVFDGNCFKALEKFAPGMISPLASANSFIMIDERVARLGEGEKVKVIPIRFSFDQTRSVPLITTGADDHQG